jgi:hypothetical protein
MEYDEEFELTIERFWIERHWGQEAVDKIGFELAMYDMCELVES